MTRTSIFELFPRSDKEQELTLEQNLNEYELQQHRLGRQATRLAPTFSVTTTQLQKLPQEVVFYQPVATLNIDIVSDDRSGKRALDEAYYKETTLCQSLCEFYPTGLDYEWR